MDHATARRTVVEENAAAVCSVGFRREESLVAQNEVLNERIARPCRRRAEVALRRNGAVREGIAYAVLDDDVLVDAGGIEHDHFGIPVVAYDLSRAIAGVFAANPVVLEGISAERIVIVVV